MKKEDYVFAPHGSAPAGPCGFCGYQDKRHRMWDTILGRFKAGETIAELATDYDYGEAEMEQWLRLAVTAPKRKRRTQGTPQEPEK